MTTPSRSCDVCGQAFAPHAQVQTRCPACLKPYFAPSAPATPKPRWWQILLCIFFWPVGPPVALWLWSGSKIGWKLVGTVAWFILLLAFLGSGANNQSTTEQVPLPHPSGPPAANLQVPPGQYILKHEEHNPDEMHPEITWSKYKVVVTGRYDAARLKSIAEDVMAKSPPGDAMVMYAYTPGTGLNGAYTAGEVSWGPGGEPSEIRLHPELKGQPAKFKIDVVSTPVSAVQPAARRIPESRRRRIFYRLIQIQDEQERQQGIGHADVDVSERRAARQFGISAAAVDAIQGEGMVARWPMPPDPVASRPEGAIGE